MKGFILTRQWRDTSSGIKLDIWLASEAGPALITIPKQKAVCFFRKTDLLFIKKIISSKPSVELKTLQLKNYHGESVMGLYCLKQSHLRDIKKQCDLNNIALWEADIKPCNRFLMERFITAGVDIEEKGNCIKDNTNGSSYLSCVSPSLAPVKYKPKLHVVSLDIETSLDAKTLYSIAAYSQQYSFVFMVDEYTDKNLTEGIDEKQNDNDSLEFIYFRFKSQHECLLAFFDWFQRCDPDVIIGWHVVQFDLRVLENICQSLNLSLNLGRANQALYWRSEGDDSDVKQQRFYVSIPGRIVLDGIELLRTAFYHFDSFSLQAVASELLGEGKLIESNDRGAAITDLYRKNKLALAQYNLQDCKLVWDIFKKTDLLDFAIERASLTGLPMDRMGGSVASFDYAYLPRLHRLGYVAPNLGELESDITSPGGYVMQSKPGIYQDVLVLDFKSLYPSIIRSFSIDPYAFWVAEHEHIPAKLTVPGFNGARFSKNESILPELIRSLWEERDKAKLDNNQPLSQAIKIMMNSFYGVLGSQSCRFYDPRVCSSITLRGHEIMQCSKDWIVGKGFDVIYGDTDSLFISLADSEKKRSAKDVGYFLADNLNKWWRDRLKSEFNIDSALEIEFETHYTQFLMPTIRGSTEGSKKRYAGMVSSIVDGKSSESLVFKGLETVRNDWTPLAKEFQQGLYYKVFKGDSYHESITEVLEDLLKGALDEKLIYRKRLRRALVDYQKSNPPHVKAARRLFELNGRLLGRGDSIAYVITTNGPEPVECRQSRIDYQHYIDKQLRPVANSILNFIDDSFDNYSDKQLYLI